MKIDLPAAKEKNDQVGTESALMIEGTTILVEEMIESEAIGFVPPAEMITLLLEQNAIVVENQSKGMLASVETPSEMIAVTVAVEVVMIVAVEAVMTEGLATKNNTIEMIGFAPHVKMITSLSELNAINVVNLGQEDNHVEATEEADAIIIVEDVEETEEVDSAEDAMVIVEDVEETEEVDSAEDAMVIVEDVEETETAVVVMNAQVSNIVKLVENDLVMLTIDLLKKSNPVDISDVMTTITEVKR